MKILVTGASGLVGTALTPVLSSAGHEVIRLVRRPPQGTQERQWRPDGTPDPQTFQDADAVINLAGEQIAGRWSESKKAAIRQSRILATRTVAQSLIATRSAQVLVSSSAIGFYGDRAGEPLSEESHAGTGFLSRVCQEWEAEAEQARGAGLRVVRVRTGLVLARHGGALARMLPPFRMGVGGRVGSGRQWWSWITLRDLTRLFSAALSNPRLNGAVNAAAPGMVPNSEFTAVLADVLHRPAIFPLPEFVVKLGFGEMGQELLLASQRVQPTVALAAGFQFEHPNLRPALEAVLRAA